MILIVLVALLAGVSYGVAAMDEYGRFGTVLLWTLACMVGVGVHAVGLLDAVVDLAYVRRERLSDDYETLAASHVRSQAARLIAKGMLAGMGVAVMILPVSQALRIITTAALLCAVSLLTLESLLDRITRRRIDAGQR